ncbi:MAG TPA: type IIL restriction-modification enzyme MmeI, partial [Polyangiaceae bacterium]
MQIQEFIASYRDTREERANKDSYLKDLCRVLGVPEPNGKTGDPERDDYVFEADSVLCDEDGRRHVGKMDLYKRGHFVLEAKQTAKKSKGKPETAQWKTPGWNLAMSDAAGQALRYARTLDEPPPFIIVADIAQCFDLYACFDGSGAYRAFPNAQKHRLWFKELEKHADLLRKIWTDPFSLDPRRYSERVTQEVAAELAKLAEDLESTHEADLVAKFL